MKKRILLYNEKFNNKGFTLIELLAVIAIFAIVISIVTYAVIGVIRNVKDKSYKVTINNIENVASDYVLENLNDKISWMILNSDTQYTCVSVQDLIDDGYYKNDVLDSYVSDDDKVSAKDYIYLQRDKVTKTIEIKKLLVNEEDNGLCGKINNNIKINVTKHNDCNEINGWSKCKKVDITYHITNISDSIDSYQYKYAYVDKNNVIVHEIEYTSFTKNSEYVNFKVEQNGDVHAYIDDEGITKEVSGIDNVGPKLASNYKGDKIVNDTVTIPIVVSDEGVGVDGSSFTKDDLEITIGDKKIIEGITFTKVNDNRYNLKIDNSTDTGEIVIKVAENKVSDLLGNSNVEFIFYKESAFEAKKVT